MYKKRIISKVKMLDEEKVAVSLRLPISLKKELQEYSDKEKVSMNTLIIETMYSLINDECGAEIDKLTTEINLAREIIEYFKDIIVLSDEEISLWSNNGGTASMIEERNLHLKDRIKMNSSILNFLKKEQK